MKDDFLNTWTGFDDGSYERKKDGKINITIKYVGADKELYI